MIGWLRETMLEADNITEDDCDLVQVTDDPGEAVEMLESFYEEHPISPNF
jgi:predicted Rossmann-fold nucleotide-binding protein